MDSPHSNGTQFGDSKKLLEWILEMDKTTDYFVISLDQLLSEGLVNSRALTDTVPYEEYKIINAIVELSKIITFTIIDTVARLATCTVGYQGATLETYNYLRQYNITPRTILTGYSLSVKNIVAGYRRDEKERVIPVDSNYSQRRKEFAKRP